MPVNKVTTTFAGKSLAHLTRRNKAFGVEFSYGTVHDLLVYYNHSVINDDAVSVISSISRVFMDQIQHKQEEIAVLAEGVELLSIDEQRERYSQVVKLGNEVSRLTAQLEELTQ